MNTGIARLAVGGHDVNFSAVLPLLNARMGYSQAAIVSSATTHVTTRNGGFSSRIICPISECIVCATLS